MRKKRPGRKPHAPAASLRHEGRPRRRGSYASSNAVSYAIRYVNIYAGWLRQVVTPSGYAAGYAHCCATRYATMHAASHAAGYAHNPYGEGA